MTYTTDQATLLLRNLGFRIRTAGEYQQALASFQGGYNLGAWLVVDGQLGPATSAALARSETNRKAHAPTASAHFSFVDFRCGCKGRYPGCRVAFVHRELLWSLERYRTALGGLVRVVSGYRCPSHNNAVGGASNSQHMYGTAADLEYRMHDIQLRSMNIAAGIGRSASSHMVRHLDRRDVSTQNLTGGSLRAPTIWNYSS